MPTISQLIRKPRNRKPIAKSAPLQATRRARRLHPRLYDDRRAELGLRKSPKVRLTNGFEVIGTFRAKDNCRTFV